MGYQAASSGNLSSGALASKGASPGRGTWPGQTESRTKPPSNSRSGCVSPGAGLPGCTGSPLSAGPRGFVGFVAGDSKQRPQTPADTSSRGSGSSGLRWKGSVDQRLVSADRGPHITLPVPTPPLTWAPGLLCQPGGLGGSGVGGWQQGANLFRLLPFPHPEARR